MERTGSTAASRRGLLRLLGVGLLLALTRPLAALLRVRRESGSRAAWPRTLDHDQPQGLSFHGDLIIRRDGDLFTALNARCPHLGCRVDRSDADELVCPCHGSRFTPDGAVLKGPATRDLEPMALRHDREAESIVVG